MTMFNDYLIAGLKSLERRRLGRSQPPPPSPIPPAAPEQGFDLIAGATAHLAWPPSLADLLERVASLPPFTITLGGCEDGLPFLLDLTNPAPGSLLAWGQAGSGKRQWLRGIVTSAVVQNDPDEVMVSLVTTNLETYAGLAQSECCHEALACDDPAVADLLDDLAWEIEQRKRGAPPEPALLLVIDDLIALQHAVDEVTFERLCRVVRHGPRSRVWCVASVDPQLLPKAAERMSTRAIDALCGAFRTHLVGRMTQPTWLQGRIPGELPDTRHTEAGIFFVSYGGEWLPLWACVEEEKGSEE